MMYEIEVVDGGHLCFFQAEDGIRDLVRSRGLGDVYKRQIFAWTGPFAPDLAGPLPLQIDELDNLVLAVGHELSLIHI